jgi:hypothetical protein
MHAEADQRPVRPRPPLLRALGRDEPPDEIEADGHTYRLVRVFKHDSWAATALYDGPADPVVCKFNRRQRVGPVPMGWLGRRLAARELHALHRLADLPGVPRPLGPIRAAGRVLPNACGHDFIAGHPLGKHERVGDGFFLELAALLAAVHARNMAYVDLHKRENILVGDDGRPYLVDFQIGFALPARWPGNAGPVRAVLGMLQRADRYHLHKHVVQCRPDQAADLAPRLEADRPAWIRAHRVVGQPLRALRRWLLVRLGVRAGRGRVETEHFPEEVVRADRDLNRAA